MKPLRGIKVLDLSRILAGPWCAQLLADLGATVIKVERPFKGDDTRGWKSSTIKDLLGQDSDESAYYLAANRGKRSITVDFSKKEGQQIIKKLARQSDVLIENFKTNTLIKYQLDYDNLKKENPSLIYCSITGFGQTGPYSSMPGYDYIIQAMAGIMSVTGERDELEGGGPMRCGIPIVDLTTGLYATIAILSALHRRNSTNEGVHIDLALFDTAIALMSIHLQNTLLSGNDPARIGNTNPYVVPYQVFKGSDKSFVLAVGNDAQFCEFCKLIDHPELCNSDQFNTNANRLKNRNILIPIIQKVLKTRTANEWCNLFREHNIPVGLINKVSEVVNDCQVKSREIFFGLDHPLLNENNKKLTMISSPIRFFSKAESANSAPPMRGEATNEILEQLNFSKEQIYQLRQLKIIE